MSILLRLDRYVRSIALFCAFGGSRIVRRHAVRAIAAVCGLAFLVVTRWYYFTHCLLRENSYFRKTIFLVGNGFIDLILVSDCIFGKIALFAHNGDALTL